MGLMVVCAAGGHAGSDIWALRFALCVVDFFGVDRLSCSCALGYPLGGLGCGLLACVGVRSCSCSTVPFSVSYYSKFFLFGSCLLTSHISCCFCPSAWRLVAIVNVIRHIRWRTTSWRWLVKEKGRSQSSSLWK